MHNVNTFKQNTPTFNTNSRLHQHHVNDCFVATKTSIISNRTVAPA